ncbi:DUF1176 domain-containing protein [Devosia sediminis]|uniref:DUF1176 domain-containing protein n=1 Tax=Devosia sediminis TaxID=2798801 RepID=A0A934IY59_9HYPH|nr:DUF1176 domain-containing protein [Devosia sediminis]MBJ3784385.1 DUF1176 domain-containing protein [Devosia sediminis]
MIRPLLWLPLIALSAPAALAQEASLEKRVMKLHALAGGDWCEPDGFLMDEEERFNSWTFSYQPSWDPEGEPEEVTLFRVWCMSGAYNANHAFYILTESNGLLPLTFAMPTYEAKYEEDDGLDGPLESLTMTGMGTSNFLVNSVFDEDSLTITSHSLWRGIGDAASSGWWVFADGEFTLQQYDIDASYDGEVNPETIVDYWRG